MSEVPPSSRHLLKDRLCCLQDILATVAWGTHLVPSSPHQAAVKVDISLTRPSHWPGQQKPSRRGRGESADMELNPDRCSTSEPRHGPVGACQMVERVGERAAHQRSELSGLLLPPSLARSCLHLQTLASPFVPAYPSWFSPCCRS